MAEYIKGLLVFLAAPLFFAALLAGIASQMKDVFRENYQGAANVTVSRMIYIKDPRTNVCIMYDTGFHGFTAVPTENVPQELLITAELK